MDFTLPDFRTWPITEWPSDPAARDKWWKDTWARVDRVSADPVIRAMNPDLSDDEYQHLVRECLSGYAMSLRLKLPDSEQYIGAPPS